MTILRAGIAQLCSGTDPAANAAMLAGSLDRLATAGATIAFTPEMTNLVQRHRASLLKTVLPEAQDPCLATAIEAARRHRMAVCLGSLAIRRNDGLIANRAFLIGPNGAILARYDKIHLFDVTLPNGDQYRESASFVAGDEAVVATLGSLRIGLSICYDLRFPALYAALAQAGAQLIAVPAAFTVPTGQAHWAVLLRARAIETGAFVVAAAQVGHHEDGRETWGHALVVDPWGQVLVDLGDTVGERVVDLDLDRVTEARTRIPALAHARAISPLPTP